MDKLANGQEVWWSLIVGTSLGSALSPFGSIATIIAIREAARQGVEIDYRDFLRLSVPATLAAVLIYFTVLMRGV